MFTITSCVIKSALVLLNLIVWIAFVMNTHGIFNLCIDATPIVVVCASMRSFLFAKLFDLEITKITQNACLNAQVVARSASETHNAFEA